MSKKTKQALPRSRITVSAVTPELVEEQIEYVKESVTNFSIPLREIKAPRATSISYDVLWVMPGYGTSAGSEGNTQADVLSQGVLCDLRRSTYKIENLSPYTLFLRLQRPMGYKNAPTALGMWEPAIHGKDSLLVPIKPHTTKNFHFSNGSTGLMCPRQEMRQGKPCVHLASFALFREPLSDYGTIVSDAQFGAQDGVNVTVVTEYRANDGSVGRVGEYGIVSYAGSKRLDEINTGPPPPVRICDLRMEGGNAEFATVNRGTAGELFLQFNNADGGQVQDVDALDHGTIYSLPFGFPGKVATENRERIARYIRWADKNDKYTPNAWILCDLAYNFTDRKLEIKTILTAPNFEEIDPPLYLGSALLQPVVATSFAYKLRPYNNRIKHRVNATVHESQCYQGLSDIEDGILDTFLTALVVIVKVVKVGIEIAGMVGVLAVSPPELPTSVVLQSSA